jgi:tRNA threonylcarbamoyladenosine biosynthesis protein TsaB
VELCIDTSTRYASVALTQGAGIIKAISWHSSNNHTLELASTVSQMLKDAGKDTTDIHTVIVAKGPGGFSALRVGMGVAKGLAESLDIPLIGVSTLELEAAQHFNAVQGPLCPLLEVGRERIAWSLYQLTSLEWSLSMNEQVTTLEAMVDAVPDGTIFCGEGAWSMSARLQELAGPSKTVLAGPPPSRQLAVLSTLGLRILAAGEVADATAMEPNYLRQPSITMPSSAKPK